MAYGLLGPDLGLNTAPQYLRPGLLAQPRTVEPYGRQSPLPAAVQQRAQDMFAGAQPDDFPTPVQMTANLPPQEPEPMMGLLGGMGDMNYGLLGMGLGLLQAGGPSLTPQSVGAGALGGLMQGQQMGAQAAEAQAAQQQRAAMEQAIAQLPPDQQLAARANPEAFFGQQAKSFFPDAPDLPSGMRMGQNGPEWIPGYLEAQMRLKQAGRSSTNITVDNPQYGAIPAGYQMVRDPATGAVRMEPVAGSPAQTEAAAAAEQQKKTERQKETSAGIVIQDIDRTLDMLENSTLPVAGLGGAMLQSLPGTAAHDASKLLESVRAASGFERLQQMREQSPTGGALGQVTERELALLTSALGNLDLSQSPEQFADNLRRVRNIFLDIVHGPGNGPTRSPLAFLNEGQDDDLTPDEQAILQQYGVP